MTFRVRSPYSASLVTVVQKRFAQWILDTRNRPYNGGLAEHQQEWSAPIIYMPGRKPDRVEAVFSYCGCSHMISTRITFSNYIGFHFYQNVDTARRRLKYVSRFKSITYKDVCVPHAKDGRLLIWVPMDNGWCFFSSFSHWGIMLSLVMGFCSFCWFQNHAHWC